MQIHTPCRHIAETRFMDVLAALLFPLTLPPTPLRPILCTIDTFMLAMHGTDFLPLALLMALVPNWGFWGLPVMHLAIRQMQWLRGAIPKPTCRDHQKEISATVAWTQENKAKLGSDGRIVLCGYSSGGHCASLYGLSKQAPKFDAVVLISGIYSLQTDHWSGGRRLLKPIFDRLVYGDILGCRTTEERKLASPDALVKQRLKGKELKGQEWYILSAKYELMGLAPFEDILFATGPLCQALQDGGAKVHKVSCGLNHWLLVLKIDGFVATLAKSLIKSTDMTGKDSGATS